MHAQFDIRPPFIAGKSARSAFVVQLVALRLVLVQLMVAGDDGAVRWMSQRLRVIARPLGCRRHTQAGLKRTMSSFPENLADRFRRFKQRHFLPNAEQYEELATYGQTPEAMIISCSDSRVDPETIFGAMPGELFVVRNVANLVPPYETGGKFHGVSSAIEFAVLNLRVKDIIVMGHSGCGGVKAALDQSAAIQTEAQFISRWMSMLDEARLSVLASHQTRPHAEKQHALEKEGVKTSIKNLRTFPFISQLEDKGRLSLHGAYFDIATGTLSVLNHSRNEFFPL